MRGWRVTMSTFRSDAERYRPMVQRRDRRWEIQAGKRRFAIVFSEHRASAPVASFQVLRRSHAPTLSVTRTVGAVLGLIGGVATIGIAIQSGRASAGSGSYVVSVPVPQRVAVAVPNIVKPVRRAAPRPTIVRPTPVDRTAPVDPMDGDDDPIASAQGLASRQAALAAAMRTGTLQQWVREGGDERGFIVAGPAQNGCRDLSILVRRFGSEDQVEKTRECARTASR